MEHLQFFLSGFILSLSLCLDIGIVNTFIINTGIRKGLLPAFLVGFGSCFGDLLYAILSISGLVLLFKIPLIKTVIWVAGNILLIVLIIKMLFSIWKDIAQATASDSYDKNHIHFFSNGFLLSLASPSSIIWFASIGSSLIAAHNVDASPALLTLFFIGFFCAGLAWSFFLALLVSTTGKYFGKKFIRFINIISIIMLSFLCIYSIYIGIGDIF